MEEDIKKLEEWLGYSEYEDYKYCRREEIPIVKAVGKLLNEYNRLERRIDKAIKYIELKKPMALEDKIIKILQED